ncbi:MAG: hypothetical protein Q8N47_02075 [Bryobacterales bacterium]|nr:hypothetical protein [Bryobacterales bacterium]
MAKQEDLFESFTPAEPGTPIFCHEDYLQKMAENRANTVGKRAALLLHRLLIDERRQHYKSTRGANRGWRRSRLGGNQGSHFYAWWAPKGAPPLKGEEGFAGAPDGAIFIRDIRHHDDHSELLPQALADHYLPIAAKDLRSQELVPAPWTPAQARFASARQKIRIIKGHPGSGKTTALWNAAEAATARSALYITYSRDLAALAQAHFRRYAPAGQQFRVVTFANFVRELTESQTPHESENDSRRRFVKQLVTLPPRLLGPWADERRAMYDEIHAHLIGAALPVQIGRFGPCNSPRLHDRDYRDQRRQVLGGEACDALTEVVSTLMRREGAEFHEHYFPELLLAWQAAIGFNADLAQKLERRKLLDFDCIALDEAQDLTPLESWLVVQFAAAVRERGGQAVSLLVAGDEAQTVRPTDFEWGWFQDLLHFKLGSPVEFSLGANLRSPHRIAALVNVSWDLYSTIAKQDRPSGGGDAETDDDSSDQILYCAAAPGPALDTLLDTLSEREGLAVISLSETLPDWIPERLRHKILTVSEAKGLDFHSVCALDPGRHLDLIVRDNERLRRSHQVEPLSRRLAIDQLRVAISRPTERLYFLDVSPSEIASKRSLWFLNRAGRSAGEISPVIPEAVLKTLEEELLDPEERIRLCEADARQFLDVKPEMAWTRAKQAVALLGLPVAGGQVIDKSVRTSAYLTLAQVSFCLAFRKVALAPVLGQPNLYGEVEDSVRLAGREDLRGIMMAARVLDEFSPEPSVGVVLLNAFEALENREAAIEPWLAVEFAARAHAWMQLLERVAMQFPWAPEALKRLPFVYRFFQVTDAGERLVRAEERAVDAMIAGGFPDVAMTILERTPGKSPRLLAHCYEAQREHAKAAEIYEQLGLRKEALRNLRAIPDIQKSLDLARQMEDHPAAPSLQWMGEVDRVLLKRPENFLRVATEAEKKYFQALLESNLPGARRTPAKRAPRKPRKPTA